MGVTRILLLILAGIYALLSFVAILSFIPTVFDTNSTPLYSPNESFLFLYSLVSACAYFVIPMMLSYLAARDLKALPLEVFEKFQLKGLGLIGWLGVAMICAGILTIFGALFGYHYRSTVENISADLVIVTYQFDDAVQFPWLGALCLYARYRIAANKRFESM